MFFEVQLLNMSSCSSIICFIISKISLICIYLFLKPSVYWSLYTFFFFLILNMFSRCTNHLALLVNPEVHIIGESFKYLWSGIHIILTQLILICKCEVFCTSFLLFKGYGVATLLGCNVTT